MRCSAAVSSRKRYSHQQLNDKIMYGLNQESFIRKTAPKSKVLFQSPNSFTVIENFEIKRVLKSDDFHTSMVIYNSATAKFKFLRLIKKWNSYDSATESTRSYANVFSNYSNPNPSCLVPLDVVLESSAFLYLVSDFYEQGNLYDYIYKSHPTKRTLSERAVAVIASQLLNAMEVSHAAGKVLLCIKPENVYIKDPSKVILSHLAKWKLHFKDVAAGVMTEHYDYFPPEMFASNYELEEVTPAVDYWYLGIML